MKDFKLRSITEISTDGRIEVSKMRNSNGYLGITIKELVEDGKAMKTSISFTDSVTCEEDIQTLIDLLIKIVNHPCLLEEGGEEK